MKINGKAFTLIELMVVISIIGILAITIVPRLTGAQAQARDTGRISSLNSITTVLESYYNSYSEYPDPIPDGCLSDEKGKVSSENLEKFFKGNKAPLDPQLSNVSNPCNKKGSFGYKLLNKNGIDRTGYIITTNVEEDAKANADYKNLNGLEKYEDIESKLGVEKTRLPKESDSIYVLLN